MPPAAKRKRGDRTYSHDSHESSNRPSPHRPESLGLAQQNRNQGYHNHNQAYDSQHTPGHSSQRGGARGARRYDRGGRQGTGQSHQPNGLDGTVSADGQSSRAEGLSSQDPTSSSQSIKPPTASSPAPTDFQRQNATPNPSQQSTALATSQSQTQQTALPKPRPYYFKNITDERLQSWEANGRAEVIEVIKEACNSQDPIQASMRFQEVIRAGLDGRLEASEAGKLIADSLADASEQDVNFAELFLDTLSVLMDAEPTHPRVKDLALATNISPMLMREVLETSLLQTLGLIRPTFDRMMIRKQTSLLYKQSNYNLLREETEGYSKLITELFTTTNNEPPTAEVVENTFENIKALIGAFDLDAGRVLDVTLDVFASLLVKHYRFFVKLLRTSSWWPQPQNYGLDVEEQGFSSLPPWAQPGHSSWLATEEEKEEISRLKSERDERFWERAREVGMDAFFELGARRVVGPHDLDTLINAAMPDDPNDVRVAETREWIKSTRTLPPSGNPVAAQLLGFKLRFYASTARDAHDTLPVNLIYLAALLIKIGFISLRDLYPHLHPKDDAMEGVKDRTMKEKEERELAKRPGAGGLNALMKAGALTDDTVPQPAAVGRLRDTATRGSTPSKSDPHTSKAESSEARNDPATVDGDEEEEELPEPSDQKVQLLKSLLCIGAIPESLYLLGRYTWLPNAYPDLPEHIHRILHHSLQKVYEPLRPLQQRDGLREGAKIPSSDQSGLSKGDLRLQDAQVIKTLRWAQLDKNDTNEGIDYRFYWDDWSDNVPICQNVDDVFTLCNTFLNISGVKIGQDSTLLVKLARIGKHSLTEDFSRPNQNRWIDLCKRLLAPALSLTNTNPGVVNEVYSLLKMFSTVTRYAIYNEWFSGATSRLPDLVDAFALARAETKDILRRMTKTNQRLMARTLAKAACASPGIVFQVVLSQLESYENFIDVVVECGRYFTYMGYDILTWALLSSLNKAGRSRVSEQNLINASKWLAALSTFAGKLSKRYSIMNTLPVLQYVLHQLCRDSFIDLEILRELVHNMAGISPDTDFSESQVQAMAGGELLQSQVLLQVHDKRNENKAAGKRLAKTVFENGIAGPLLVAIAQQRQRVMFNENLTEPKVIVQSLDKIHLDFTQYLEMLRHNLSIKEFDQAIPDIYSLMSEYGIDASVAFMIHRKGIAKAIEEYDEAHPTPKKRGSESYATTRAEKVKSELESLKVPEDVVMSEAAESDPSTQLAADPVLPDKGTKVAVGSEGVSEPTEVTKAAEADVDIEMNGVSEPPRAKPELPDFQWHPVTREIMDKIRRILPADFEDFMSLPFFVSFWQLSLNDLTLPTQSYNEEISRQKEKLAAINADRSDVSVTGVQKKEKDKKAVNEFLSRLTEEMKNSVSRHSHVRQRLDKEKQHWFLNYNGKVSLVHGLLQECFLPRMLISPFDAQYAWRMFNFLHSSGTPEFRTMFILDRLFNEKFFANVMFQCTGREAENFAVFLKEIFKELASWHASRSEYEKRAFGAKKNLIGFAKKTRDGKVDTLLDYEEFRNLLYKWHTKVFQALTSALQNTEFQHIKNACTILQGVVTFYPAINWMGEKLLGLLDGLHKIEAARDKGIDRRDDIFTLSMAVLANLHNRKKNWVLPQAFHLNNKNSRLKAPERPSSTAPKSPQPDDSLSSKPLNAEAPSFEPKPSASVNEEPKHSLSAKIEVEDGELEDQPVSVTKKAESVKEETQKGTGQVGEKREATPPSKQENKKDEFAEMRAKVQASADAKRRQTQTVSADSRPSSAGGGSANATPAPPSTSAPVPSQSKDGSVSSLSGGHSTPIAGPQPPSTSIAPPRPDIGRTNSTPGASDRQPHALPNRPEPLNSHRTRYPTRAQDIPPAPQPDRQDSRGHPLPDAQHSERPGQPISQRYNERNDQKSSRAESSAGYQRQEEPGHPGDQGYQDARGYRQGPMEYSGRPPPRDIRSSGRDLMDSRLSSGREGRQDQQQGPSSRYDGYAAQSQPPSRSSVAVPSTPEADNSIITARNLPNEMVEKPTGYIRQHETPHNNDGSGRTPRSRPDSPMRGDGRSGDSRRDTRHDLPRAGQYDTRAQRDASAATDHAPNGPRNGPSSSRHGYASEGHSRSDLMQPPPARAPYDRNSGRPHQDYGSRQGRYQDDNYGRLNADPDISRSFPGSTHDRNSRSGDQGPLAQARNDRSAGSSGQSIPPSSSSIERQPHNDATPDHRNRRQTGDDPSLTPQTPAEESNRDLVGVHPSRLEENFKQAAVRPPPLQTSEPLDTQASQQQPPAGPRSAQARSGDTLNSSGSLPSPAPRNAPAGPASIPDRRGRDGPARRQFADVQQTLSQSGQTNSPSQGGPLSRSDTEQGTSIRGRASAGRGPHSQAPPANPDSRPVQNGHSGPTDYSRDSRQGQSQSQPPWPPSDRERRGRESPDMRSSGATGRERSPQRETRSHANRDYRERDDPAGTRSHRTSREQSRDTRGPDLDSHGPPPPGAGGRYPREREREQEREAPQAHHGYGQHQHPQPTPPPHSNRDPGGARLGGYETRHRSARDYEREREQRPYPTRGGSGNSGWNGPETGASAGGGWRGDERDRDRREPHGPGSGPAQGPDGRKRWAADDGGAGSVKRQRRSDV